jgi:hypothetical protein
MSGVLASGRRHRGRSSVKGENRVSKGSASICMHRVDQLVSFVLTLT